MISLIQYAKETADRPVDFLEYLNLFTGYDLNSPKRTDKECQEIYADFEKKFSEQIVYMEFADHYKWYFVQECQLNHISSKECNAKWATLEVVAKKTDLTQTKTFTEWKEYFYAMASKLEDWALNESVKLMETLWRNFSDGSDKITISKKDLAMIVETAYQEGKSNGR